MITFTAPSFEYRVIYFILAETTESNLLIESVGILVRRRSSVDYSLHKYPTDSEWKIYTPLCNGNKLGCFTHLYSIGSIDVLKAGFRCVYVCGYCIFQIIKIFKICQ